MTTFKEPTTTAWRQFVLKATFKILDDENYTHDIIIDDYDDVGDMVFNGGIYDYDDKRHDKAMDELYTEYFKPFLANLKIDEVDMYISIRDEIEDEYGFEITHGRLKMKSNILAFRCQQVIRNYKEDFQTAYVEDDGWIAFQALWRGHGCRWKYPFFTFKN